MRQPTPRRRSDSLASRGRGEGTGGARGGADAPLRSELLSLEQMEEHGRVLAGEHRLAPAGRSNDLLQRLGDNEAMLRASCEVLAGAIKSGHRITPAGEWLLDNLYLIDTQIRTARRHFPKRYNFELPRLERGASAGLPRVYDIALNAISHGDGRVDQDTLSRFVRAYQEIAPLTIGELWAIPIMLRLALIENLRRVAARVRSDRHDRNLAARWSEAMIDMVESDPKSLILVVSDMARSDPPMHGPFVAELVRRLQGHSASLALPLTWIEQRLREAGLTIDQLVNATNQEEAADQVSISNSIGSLRLLEATDWRAFVEGASIVEQTLRRDPAGVHARMDFSTRDRYRHQVERLAREARRGEPEVARLVVELAEAAALAHPEPDARVRHHVGHYLVDAGLAELRSRLGLRHRFARWRTHAVPFPAYFGALLGVGALLAIVPLHLLARTAPSWWLAAPMALAAVIGLSQLAVALVNLFAAVVVKPEPLPRMDLEAGIPAEAGTLVVVPSLLGSATEAGELVEDLEVRYLANRDPMLRFALLTDFSDAAGEEQAEDATLLGIVREGVKALNARHAHPGTDRFFLMHRPRRWSESERAWMGYERKRGKLGQLNALLRGRGGGDFSCLVGDMAQLQGIRYVITLDADTRLPSNAARELVATMEHPLNRPRFDDHTRRVVAGYGILQPRIGSTLTAEGTSRYAMLFGGEPGLDPYTRAVSDTYQDLFGEGSFIGKGIYDVDAFEYALAGRLPENRILSHDLLEGCYVRSGLASGTEFYEDYPPSYRLDGKRRRRWIRGDWQIAEWLLPTVPASGGRRERNVLSPLSRWKIFDNLRRSLVAPALFALLLLGWGVLRQAPFWSALVLEVLLLPVLLDMALGVARRPPDISLARHLSLSMRDAGRRLAQFAFQVAMLPREAVISMDAILRTFWRVHFSRRHLLQWVASRSARDNPGGQVPLGWIGPAVAVLAGAWLADTPRAFWIATPWLVLWLVGPLVERWLAGAVEIAPEPLEAGQVRFLRRVARRTWAFFEEFVGEETHWLPPDNYQEAPIAKVAPRTSPTNIGLALLANLTAFDFGYLSAAGLLERTARSFDTLDRLERYNGHFYNWYDLDTLKPLLPHYVSTVDSGNLLGHLLTLRQGLLEIADAPLVDARALAGLADGCAVLEEACGEAERAALDGLRLVFADLDREPPATPLAIRDALRRVVEAADDAARQLSDSPDAAATSPAAFADAARGWLQEVEAWLPHTAEGADTPPTLRQLARGEEDTGARFGHATIIRARERLQEIERLAGACVRLAEADYRFLYEPRRHLFAIGYNVGEAQRDSGFYDLLASEVRLGIFAVIAQGQIPQDGWFALGRLLTAHDGPPTLLSWSGSMFEYLMPMLVMPTYPGSLLAESCRGAVTRQIAYGRSQGVPWGISESGYNLTDAAQNYQYRAFGVPGLGLQRGLSQELVIAPYATALALAVVPRAATDNLAAMAELGWLTRHGFYEAVDYTPTRQPPGQQFTIVRQFMAHHQGMSLVAFDHALNNRIMQRRFAADPQFMATLLLLQERAPRSAGEWASNPEIVDVRSATGEPQVPLRVFRRADTPRPAMQVLSNGRYHVMVTAAGGGYSRWGNLALTRWREDATCDSWGTFLYFRDCDSGAVWSSTFQPTRAEVDSYEAVFTESRIEFRCRANQLDAHTEIVVSPEDDIELRRTRLTNRSGETRTLEVTSYAEVVLAPAISDDLHPAFSNLFVQTERVESCNGILCTRRPRSRGEAQPWMFHLIALHDVEREEVSFETDRMRFLGRGNGAHRPAALAGTGRLSGSTGSVLDPIVASRHRFRLAPGATACIDLVTGIAAQREACVALADKYRDRHIADRVIDLAWTHSRVVLGQINVSEVDAQAYARLAECVMFADPQRRAAPAVVASNRRGQSGLWAHAISGDLPIVLLQVRDNSGIELVRQLVHAHAYCRLKGVAFDLVIWNGESGGYRQNLQDEIHGVIGASVEAGLVDHRGGIFVRGIDQINHEDRVLMLAVARVVLSDEEGPLNEQLRSRSLVDNVPLLAPGRDHVPGPVVEPELPPRLLANGIGGFSEDMREYVIDSGRGRQTPAPWVNIIANPAFGCVVSASGAGYTWFDNAHEYRLTPWSNDPVEDPNTEAFYIRDEETGHYWSPTPLPVPGAARYVSRHGFGYSVFETVEDGIASDLGIHVDAEAPVKFFRLLLRNDSGRTRRLSVTGYVEWVLGDLSSKTAMHVVTEVDATGALLARNAYNTEFDGYMAFFDVSGVRRTLTADRTEFIGRNGSLRAPAAMRRAALGGRVGAGHDPCGAIQVPLELADGETRTVLFRLGAGRNQDETVATIRRFRESGAARASFDGVAALWQRMLGAVQVQTPDPALDALVNGWLPYQVIACRMWGRSGFYQSGGAFGFRDQLQDAMALVHAAPELLRAQLLLCASRQFHEGDVQHWWHPPLGRGVRTHCSDDYLWLPFATHRYIGASGDWTVLDEEVGFLDGRALNPDEESYYDMPLRSSQRASLYGHCVRAIERGFALTGARGLPLIGSGDWNDGMNNVGREGSGESVWLGFFLYRIATGFAALARHRGDEAFAVRCEEGAAALRNALEEHGWDGAWYRRAWYDDGTPLGSTQSEECRIDSIAQSWSVLSGAGDPERTRLALDSLDEHLVHPEAGLIQLLTPPFDTAPHDPGYIRGYVPGVRENGGQYTHAAIWAVMAFAEAGRTELAWELFDLINPLRHGSADSFETWKVEPYVVAADVLAVPPHTGRGGWTWYTGAAGWMYRLIVESLLGIHREGDALAFRPHLPRTWPEAVVTYRFGDGTYRITLRHGNGAATRVILDGEPLEGARLPMTRDGGTHEVEVLAATRGVVSDAAS
ncbi:MAG: cyclic beta 1-2 glucan synthetase [Xanthomonadales bacterium]|nr:cyclic beta 1-2 glucan synthetase [Xanthomonadales bacterium]